VFADRVRRIQRGAPLAGYDAMPSPAYHTPPSSPTSNAYVKSAETRALPWN
jgi:hypothetical protein